MCVRLLLHSSVLRLIPIFGGCRYLPSKLFRRAPSYIVDALLFKAHLVCATYVMPRHGQTKNCNGICCLGRQALVACTMPLFASARSSNRKMGRFLKWTWHGPSPALLPARCRFAVRRIERLAQTPCLGIHLVSALFVRLSDRSGM